MKQTPKQSQRSHRNGRRSLASTSDSSTQSSSQRRPPSATFKRTVAAESVAQSSSTTEQRNLRQRKDKTKISSNQSHPSLPDSNQSTEDTQQTPASESIGVNYTIASLRRQGQKRKLTEPDPSSSRSTSLEPESSKRVSKQRTSTRRKKPVSPEASTSHVRRSTRQTTASQRSLKKDVAMSKGRERAGRAGKASGQTSVARARKAESEAKPMLPSDEGLAGPSNVGQMTAPSNVLTSKGKGKAVKAEGSAIKKTSSERKASQKKPKRQADPKAFDPAEEQPSPSLHSPVAYNDCLESDQEDHLCRDIDEDEHMEQASLDEEGHDPFDDDDDDDNGWAHGHYNEEEEDEHSAHEDMSEVDDELASMQRNLGLHIQNTFGGMVSDVSSRLRSILNSIKGNDPTMQLIALQELAEVLSVSSEDNLAGYFASDSFVKELVRIMKKPDDMFGGGNMDDSMMVALAMGEGLGGENSELALLACRCISNLLDAMPTAVTSVVYHGAISVLCQKLKSIQYIDLAEQALYALEKVSSQLPRSVVHESGLSACLAFFDFFSIHAQRTALRTAANCLRGADADAFPQVLEVVPTLLNTMSNSDRSIVELSCLCWVRLAESYRNHPELLEKAVSTELLGKLKDLMPIPGHPNPVRPSTFSDLLRILRVIAKASPTLAYELLKSDIIGNLYQVITAVPLPDTNETVIHVTIDSKWRDSIQHILKIISDLLPSLPKDDMFSTRRFRDDGPVARRTRSTRASPEVDASGDKSDKPSEADPRVDLLKDDKQVLHRVNQLMVPVLLEVYTSTVNLRIRQLVIHILVKLIHFTEPDTLQTVLKDIPLSSFLAGVLAQKEHATVVLDALYQAEMLIKKLPDVYRFLFEREGVLHEAEVIANQPFTEESTNDGTAGIEKSRDSPEDEASTSSAMEVTPAHYFGSQRDTQSDMGDDDETDKVNAHSDANSDSSRSRRSRQSNSTSAEDKSMAAFLSARRRLIERTELHQLLRGRYTQHTSSESEKGIGTGPTRQYVIQLAQNFVKEYRQEALANTKPGSTLEDVQNLASQLEKDTPKETLQRLSHYLQETSVGISSFELMSSGLMDALLRFLTDCDDTKYVDDVETRRQLFHAVFADPHLRHANAPNPLRLLILRLQELLSRFEVFEVVSPLESTAFGDNFRSPANMLAKQLRIRLTGEGENIPLEYRHFMVSTHAVATFKVLEEYLLTRLGRTSATATQSSRPTGSASQRRSARQQAEEEIEDDKCLEDKDSPNADEMLVDDDEEEEGAQEGASNSQGWQSAEEDFPMEKASTSNTAPSTNETQDGEWCIHFFLKDTLISNDTTVYGAMHQYETQNNPTGGRRDIWTMAYPVTYKKVWVPKSSTAETSDVRRPVHQLSNITRPSRLTEDSVCNRVLELLSVLVQLVTSKADKDKDDGVALSDFVNRKLTAKMNRQLEEPLIVASSCLPDWTYWLMLKAPFLFPFETRYLFIQSTSFGYSRLIARWQSLQMRSNNQRDDHQQQPILGRMERQKVRIVRSQMLESAIKILDLLGSAQSSLEIEYVGEEGTGLGPTLEFYAATSKEFCKRSINMWRVDSDQGNTSDEYVVAKHGLFPRPLQYTGSTTDVKVCNLFRTLGQFMAKAMLDFRIVDIPFSPVFFKIAVGQEKPDPSMVKEVDPELGRSIEMLQRYATRKREIYADTTMDMDQKSKAVEAIEVDNVKLEDLCLDFTFPGMPEIALKPNGGDIPVTIHNVEEYIDLVVDMMVGSGIAHQIAAFRRGFDDLFAIDDLKILTYDELVALFGVTTEDWSLATLANTIKADHGFTMESPAVKNLLEILSEMNPVERREFLQFATGSPRLPIGGWKALRPVFTVVRKTPEASLFADDYLPSVMTCANYLKMPDYSSKALMRERLLTSIKEGKNSFLLS